MYRKFTSSFFWQTWWELICFLLFEFREHKEICQKSPTLFHVVRSHPLIVSINFPTCFFKWGFNHSYKDLLPFFPSVRLWLTLFGVYIFPDNFDRDIIKIGHIYYSYTPNGRYGCEKRNLSVRAQKKLLVFEDGPCGSIMRLLRISESLPNNCRISMRKSWRDM